jgi:hypothetical protein
MNGAYPEENIDAKNIGVSYRSKINKINTGCCGLNNVLGPVPEVDVMAKRPQGRY